VAGGAGLEETSPLEVTAASSPGPKGKLLLCLPFFGTFPISYTKKFRELFCFQIKSMSIFRSLLGLLLNDPVFHMDDITVVIPNELFH
jgi:hypothetical protein